MKERLILFLNTISEEQVQLVETAILQTAFFNEVNVRFDAHTKEAADLILKYK